MPKISVVFVTNRSGAIEYLNKQLSKQTLQNFEVIIANDSEDSGGFKPRQKDDGDAWNLNKAYNDCLDKVTGDLVVFLQDFIWIPANGLERFWEVHEIYPDDLITGVGHKALNGIEGISETDERVIGEPGVSPGNESHFELNWAACPANKLVRFDEDMDKHYGGENQVFALKVQKQFKNNIWIDRSNRCIGLSQESCGGRPENWEELHANKGSLAKKIQQYV